MACNQLMALFRTAPLFTEGKSSEVRKIVKGSIEHAKNFGVYKHHAAVVM